MIKVVNILLSICFGVLPLIQEITLLVLGFTKHPLTEDDKYFPRFKFFAGIEKKKIKACIVLFFLPECKLEAVTFLKQVGIVEAFQLRGKRKTQRGRVKYFAIHITF